MRMEGQLRASGIAALAGSLLLFSGFAGCRNPGEEGQGQTHTQTTPDNQSRPQQPAVPTPPSADQISPDSPSAVLNGTSTTQPAGPGNQPPQSPH